MLEDGDELARAPDLKSLVECLKTVPEESLAFHGGRNDFSRWLRARAEFGLAAHLRPRRVEDFASVEHLRTELVETIDRYRRERNRGTGWRAEVAGRASGTAAPRQRVAYGPATSFRAPTG